MESLCDHGSEAMLCKITCFNCLHPCSVHWVHLKNGHCVSNIKCNSWDEKNKNWCECKGFNSNKKINSVNTKLNQ